MNERIQELAEQCRIEKYNQHGDLIEFGFDEEKFAQLMLEECMEINRKRLIPSPLWENDEHRKSHNQALWCAISDMKELLV